MSAKVSNDFSTHTRKDSCRSNSCVSACLCCVSASRHSVPSCRRSRIRRMTVPHSCAWQKPSSHFLPACAALQRRLASLNVRKSCDCWLKTFWWAKIQLRFVTAFQSPRAHLQTKGRALLSAEITFCVRGVASPILANLFLHYAFDLWMTRTHPDLPWCRYADDGLVHCRSQQEAEALKAELQIRLAECRLEMHPTKTKVVYCKDGKRRGKYPNVQFDFLGFCFRPRRVQRQRDKVLFCGFTPAVSPSAMQAMRKAIRDLNLRCQTQLSLQDIAQQLNPLLRGWLAYYGRYAPSELYPL